MSEWEPTVGTLSAEAMAAIRDRVQDAPNGLYHPGQCCHEGYCTEDSHGLDLTPRDARAFVEARQDLMRLADHIAALTAQLESARGIAVKLENDAAEAQHRIGLVRELHVPIKRWQVDPGDDYSFDTEQQVRDDGDGSDDMTPYSFDVCAHCGETEVWQGGNYRESLWPCATIRALGEIARES